MIERDFSDLLISFGMDEETANQLEVEINGNDLTNLVNDLSGNDPNIIDANKILSKYGQQITSGFSNLKNNTSESILDEDYQYFVNIDKNKIDAFIEYLDTNDINYFYDGNTEFKIDCLDKNSAYVIDKFISRLSNKEKLIDKNSSKIMENKMRKRNKKIIKESSVLVNPEIIQLASRAGLDMKRLQEAFDDLDIVDDTDDVVDDYDFDAPADDVDVNIDSDGYDDDIDIDTDYTGDLEDDGLEDTSVVSIDSDVYTTIQNSISDITNNLGNLKVSEYKPIIDSLQTLLDTARESGRSYLGEGKKSIMEGENTLSLEQMEQIARKYTDFDNLVDTNSGDDFTEISKWNIKNILQIAYMLGRKSV